ncbi:class I SAM-dependent methyltransferase [Candidatus Parcubacteria bacterium]|nr:MAG: class I SAM-dependent methyltransferase [Candidatus Parcubacteria bacterium]
MKGIIQNYRKGAREHRKAVFLEHFAIRPSTRILDIGSEDGSNIAFILEGTGIEPANVFIADIDEDLINRGKETYGFTPVRVEEDGRIDFPDHYFDIVYCSSVIEHVTVPKERVWDKHLKPSEFLSLARANQRRLADEIKRLGCGYFVQTPNRGFLFESHTWLPFVGWLPWRYRRAIIALTNRFWIKKTIPDFHLLGRHELESLFDDAILIPEVSLGHVKSWMCIKTA